MDQNVRSLAERSILLKLKGLLEILKFYGRKRRDIDDAGIMRYRRRFNWRKGKPSGNGGDDGEDIRSTADDQNVLPPGAGCLFLGRRVGYGTHLR